MNIVGTHRSAVQRMRLFLNPRLGAGNFFWKAWSVATDRDRPIFFHPDVANPNWMNEEPDSLSLNDMRMRVIHHVNWYRAQGIKPKSHVGVMTRDGLHNLLHYIAVTSLGAVPVHCNALMPIEVAAEYFRRTQVSVLIGDCDLIEGCKSAWAGAGIREDPAFIVENIEKLRVSDLVPFGSGERFPYRHADSDMVLISHSSGTTGRPKAPAFLHRSFFAGRWERLWAFPSLRSDRLLSAFPHSHSAGLAHLSMATLLGLPTVILDDTSGAAVVGAINKFSPTMVFGFPSALANIRTEDIDPAAAENIHTWCGMGDASHERHIRPLIRIGSRASRHGRVKGSDYLDGLGSSEMGMVLFEQMHNAEEGVQGRLVGRPSGVVKKAVVLGDEGSELPTGQAGRLGVRAPSVTPGYWDDAELTLKSLCNGYFITGDIVRRDGEGRWYHLDRIPDVIQSSAGPVYSLPVEEVVLLESEALDCAVIAVDDPVSHDHSCPIAVVLPDEPSSADSQILLERCNSALAVAGLSPLHALIVASSRDELPVGPTGKVLKRQLRLRHQHLLTRGDGVAAGQVAVNEQLRQHRTTSGASAREGAA